MILPEPEPRPTAIVPLPSATNDSRVPLPVGAASRQAQLDPVVQLLAQRRMVGPPTAITLESASTVMLARLFVFP